MKLKYTKAIIIILCICNLLPIVVYGDVGPKDKLTVYVKNPPEESYYLDLLTQNTKPYNNFHQDGEREALNQKMISLLYSYESEGWKPALVEGTGAPMWGNLVGERVGDKDVHTFGYYGLPDTYRIIIVTESGKISVTEAIIRSSLQSSVTYDYVNNTIKLPNLYKSYAFQLVTTFIPTIIIEGIILVLFGFKIKDNWKIFFITNTGTQILLNVAVTYLMIKSGVIAAFLAQIFVEPIIITIESVAYLLLIKEHSKKRRFFYGVVANIASWMIGFYILGFQHELLVKLFF